MLFLSISPKKTITHFAITAPPINALPIEVINVPPILRHEYPIHLSHKFHIPISHYVLTSYLCMCGNFHIMNINTPKFFSQDVHWQIQWLQPPPMFDIPVIIFSSALHHPIIYISLRKCTIRAPLNAAFNQHKVVHHFSRTLHVYKPIYTVRTLASVGDGV